MSTKTYTAVSTPTATDPTGSASTDTEPVVSTEVDSE